MFSGHNSGMVEAIMSSSDNGATIFVTDEGRSYYGAAPNPRQPNQFYPATSHQAQFLIRNKGFAAIQQRQHGLLVTCRPEIVSEKCIAAMLYIIADANPRRLIFQTPVGNDWQQTLMPFTDTTRALSRVIKLFGDPEPTETHWVLSKMLDIESPEADPRFAHFLAHWKSAGALQSNVYDANLRASLKTLARGRYFLVSARDNGDLRVVGIGDGFLSNVKEALISSIGQKLNQISDVHFAKYCEEAYRRATVANAPVLEHIDSYIKAPGRRALRRRYARLILPMLSDDGSKCLLGVSFEDNGIDLRSRVS